MNLRNSIVSTLTLFSSLSTLVCCTLPFLFVTLGAGAVLAGLVSAVPQIVWLSEHKVALFIFAGLMLLLSGVLRHISRNAPCPADPAQAKACMKTRRFSTIVFYSSLIIYCVGFFFAFVAIYVFN